jgi:hypothetical protein
MVSTAADGTITIAPFSCPEQQALGGVTISRSPPLSSVLGTESRLAGLPVTEIGNLPMN